MAAPRGGLRAEGTEETPVPASSRHTCGGKRGGEGGDSARRKRGGEAGGRAPGGPGRRAGLLAEAEACGGSSVFLGDVAKAAPTETLRPGGAGSGGGGAACP